MKLNFETPNAETVGWIDSYMQFHDDEKVQRKAEKIADSCYDGNYDGWDEQPISVIRTAFAGFLNAMDQFNITQEQINNQ